MSLLFLRNRKFGVSFLNLAKQKKERQKVDKPRLLQARAAQELTMLYLENDKGMLFLTFAKKQIHLSHNWEKPKSFSRSFCPYRKPPALIASEDGWASNQRWGAMWYTYCSYS